MKTIFYLLIIVSTGFIACKKSPKKIKTRSGYGADFFPTGPGKFWKAYYHAPSGGSGAYERGVDSFFVSTDTIGLNTISNNNNILDTAWQVYHIIKVKRTRKNFLDLNIYSEPIKNFGIVRTDTNLLTVYTAVPACTCWQTPAPVPNNYAYFNEVELFDYNMQTNDQATIHVWFDYNTTIYADSFVQNGHIVKRQYFFDNLNPGDTVASRIQFGSVLNTNRYISEIVDNILLVPNAIVDSIYFFHSLNDSILIKKDTYIIP